MTEEKHEHGACRSGALRRERKLDQALSETFPASDPPAITQPAPAHNDSKKPCCGGDKT